MVKGRSSKMAVMLFAMARMGSGGETAMLLLPCSPVIVKVAALVVARAVKAAWLINEVAISRSLGGMVKVMDGGLMVAGGLAVKEMVKVLGVRC